MTLLADLLPAPTDTPGEFDPEWIPEPVRSTFPRDVMDAVVARHGEAGALALIREAATDWPWLERQSVSTQMALAPCEDDETDPARGLALIAGCAFLVSNPRSYGGGLTVDLLVARVLKAADILLVEEDQYYIHEDTGRPESWWANRSPFVQETPTGYSFFGSEHGCPCTFPIMSTPARVSTRRSADDGVDYGRRLLGVVYHDDDLPALFAQAPHLEGLSRAFTPSPTRKAVDWAALIETRPEDPSMPGRIESRYDSNKGERWTDVTGPSHYVDNTTFPHSAVYAR